MLSTNWLKSLYRIITHSECKILMSSALMIVLYAVGGMGKGYKTAIILSAALKCSSAYKLVDSLSAVLAIPLINRLYRQINVCPLRFLQLLLDLESQFTTVKDEFFYHVRALSE